MGRRKKKRSRQVHNEADWLSSSKVEPMLKVARMSPRKRRLFACACCRRIWRLLPEEGCRDLEVAEGMIDRTVTREEQDANWANVLANIRSELPPGVKAVLSAKVGGSGGASGMAERAVEEAGVSTANEEERQQCDLLREIVANPFRPVPIVPTWFTGEVVDLAGTIYRCKTYHHVPDLGEALARAGCSDPDILNHCRQPREHLWGCWVVDLVLGKE